MAAITPSGYLARITRALAVVTVCAGLGACTHSYGYGGVPVVMSGMNQTEVQGVMGPPDYIQTRGLQQAWQYCPHLFDGRDEDLYTTIWIDNGIVTHLRAYPDNIMGSCNDFIAAFRWQDVIEGQFLPPGASNSAVAVGK